MEARDAIRTHHLLEECQVAPEIFAQVMPRLHTFMAPCVETFQGQTLPQQAQTCGCGLLSDVKRTNIAALADRLGQARLPLQGVIGWEEWDDAPLRSELIRQVKTHLGHADGVLVGDPSGLPKSGRESVGVARLWCGRLGKVRPLPSGSLLGLRVAQGPHPG